MIRKVVIFGATGMTGLCALSAAVEKGLQVTAFVRDEAKVPLDIKEKVNVVVGDVTNQEQVSNAVSGQEGVVVVLGTRNELAPTTVLSDGMKNIVDAMKKHNVEVVSVCLSAFLFYPPEKVPAIFKALNADHERQFEITKMSGLKWIAVLPPHIADAPSTKYVIKYDESSGRAISKYDLGAFLIESLNQPEHYHKVCGIANV
ncbi:flavin reductase (NADPH) [Neodiprion lecontei]|uniref:Flavin reductase (NADPH) n=1 Tax=Neodiprion lecontei TaxID=441921 RepID=A0A6J0BPB4_NEOLC|nr:flavin reductase (NADPH) [Neodiprion lecontei]